MAVKKEYKVILEVDGQKIGFDWPKKIDILPTPICVCLRTLCVNKKVFMSSRLGRISLPELNRDVLNNDYLLEHHYHQVYERINKYLII